MADLEVITDAAAGLERCGDLFRADPVGCNLVAAGLNPGFEFTLHRAAVEADTVAAMLTTADRSIVCGNHPESVGPLAEALDIEAPTQLFGTVSMVASMAGVWSERCDGTIGDEQLVRVYRLGVLDKPKKRRGQMRPTDRSRLEEAAQWAFEFGNGTESPRSIEQSVARMTPAVNEGRLIDWVAGDEVVSQLIVSPARFGIVRLGAVQTPPQFRRKGHAASLIYAVAAQQDARQKVDGVVVHTQGSNGAMNRLYRRLGFVSAGEMLSVQLTPSPRH